MEMLSFNEAVPLQKAIYLPDTPPILCDDSGVLHGFGTVQIGFHQNVATIVISIT